MNERQKKLFEKAKKKHEVIEPCAGKTFEQSFTTIEGKLTFWFNDKKGNTKAIMEL